MKDALQLKVLYNNGGAWSETPPSLPNDKVPEWKFDKEPGQFFADLSKAINDFLVQRTIVTFAWAATNSQGSPDPATTCKGKVSGISISLKQHATGFRSWEVQIEAGVSAGTYTPDSPWSCSPGSMGSAPSIPSLHLEVASGSANSQNAALENIAQQIIDWYVGLVPSAPCSGSHSAYNGAATPTKVELV